MSQFLYYEDSDIIIIMVDIIIIMVDIMEEDIIVEDIMEEDMEVEDITKSWSEDRIFGDEAE